MSKINRVMLTKREAQEIVDAHEIQQLIDNEEERELLEQNNPSLLAAYKHLLMIADGQ